MSKKLLALLLTLVLVLGMAGGVAAEQQNSEYKIAINQYYYGELINSYNIYASYGDGVEHNIPHPSNWSPIITYEGEGVGYSIQPTYVFLSIHVLSDVVFNIDYFDLDADEPTDIYFRDIYVELSEGETAQLTPTILPANANQSLTWSSSNSAVASVSRSGVVTANSVGMAFITAKTVNGLTAQCVINVIEGTDIPDPNIYTITVSESWFHGGPEDPEIFTFEVAEGESFEYVRVEPNADHVYSSSASSAEVEWEEDVNYVRAYIDAVTQDVNIEIVWVVWGP